MASETGHARADAKRAASCTDSRISSQCCSLAHHTPTEDMHVQEPLVCWTPATHAEVKYIIMQSPDKSCEQDPFPTWLLKQCIDSIVPLITSLINSSLEHGHVPADLKLARIKPILKKPGLDPDILKNYRPVSNLPFVSKVIEKVVDKRLERHLAINNIHEPSVSIKKVPLNRNCPT